MHTAAFGIIGTGSEVPEIELTNAELAERFGVTTEWIERKTGIRSRRHMAAGQTPSAMALLAAGRALAAAGLLAEQLDVIVVATSTGDSPMPPVACLVQAGLGAYRATCFDINIGCSGFVHALAVAHAMLATRRGGHALLVGTDAWSRFTDPADRSTAVLLADAAGAAVLGPVPARYGIVDSDLTGHGHRADLLVLEGGGSELPPTHATVDAGKHYLRMKGRAVTEFVSAEVPLSIKELLRRTGTLPEEIAHFVPHQANGVLLARLAEDMGLTGARLHTTLERFGNSGAASLPVTLDHAVRAGALHDGDLVLLAGFGGGMAVGNSLLRWHEPLAGYGVREVAA
ncbi:MAG TPA: ketoacyl-ACP synthase III [Actinophytocola sp.]|uniref:3-oxoacyl-ACP synthase III family protein n=1 Tax=Actinophytocola sp. TaxID=1872138 RepID=UPI002DBEF67D|nr:ketoacyl-ACP synthase III [Actinophytocola sp.]HEU5474637.1 ketoacyl-ACP synthase III [Actinophytocola sp.]